MKKKALLAVALVVVILIAVALYVMPTGADPNGSEPVVENPSQTNGSTESQPGEETTPDTGAVGVVDDWDADDPTGDGSNVQGNQNQTGSQGGSTGNQTGSQGSQGGSTGNQNGSQGSQGGSTGSQGSQGGSAGNQGGSQGSQGGSTGNQGGSQGNQGGSTGNQGGSETTPGATEPDMPTQPDEDEESGVLSPAEVTYEDYMAMTPEQQQAFYESFPSLQDYIDWFNAAKAAYDASKDDVVVDGGNIDIGDYIEKP